MLLLAAAARAPAWAFAGRASVDGDTAIVGLMARHPLRGTTLWGQPYGSPLDAWVAAPFVATLGPTPLALRVPYALLSLALVALAWALGQRARPGAGPAAALLVAVPSGYLLLLAAFPPPLYPTTLVLLGGVLVLALSAAARWREGRPPSAMALASLGTFAGLALWTHLMSLATLVVVAVLLAASAWRQRQGRRLLWALALFLVAAAPWWTRALRDPSSVAVLDVARAGASPLAHAAGVLPRLHEPVEAVLGGWSPLTADEAERTVAPPLAVRVALVAGWLVAVGIGAWSLRARAAGRALVAAVALTMAAFPLPVRSDPHTVRFLTPIVLPMAALAGAGAVRLAGAARGWRVVLPLCALQLWTAVLLVGAWRREGPAAIVPDCAPVLETLRTRGVSRAYASYHTAYCLTYASGESVVASPPWNERFYGYPMPYLDQVRGDARPAWVLVPGVDFELPSPKTFEAKVAGIGGRATRVDAGPACIYVDFVPPFGPRTASGVIAGAAGDADVTTRTVEPPGPATFALTRPVAAAGITLLTGPSAPRLPRAMDLEVSSDGTTFERIGRRRRGRETVDLAWVGGHPQFLVDDLAFSAPLDGRTIVAVRVSPVEAGPWAVAEVLVHPTSGPRAPWPAAPSAGSDAGTLYRSLLAARARGPAPPAER